VSYQQGCTNHKRGPVISEEWLIPSGGQEDRGLTGEYFNNPDLAGEPVLTEVYQKLDLIWSGEFPSLVDKDAFSARWTGKFVAPETGTYIFSLISVGLSRLYIDDELVIDNWTEQVRGEAYYGAGTKEMVAQVDLTAGQSHDITAEYSKADASYFGALRLGCLPPVPADSVERAAELAAESDAALVFVGTSDEWESEGHDRADMEAATAYAKERVQFGKPISAQQAVQFMLADMAKKIAAARLLCWHAAWLHDNGQRNTMESAIAKCFAGGTAMEVTTDAVQILGGYGYMKDYPVEKYMRDAKLWQIFEGTNQIQRLMIARQLLG